MASVHTPVLMSSVAPMMQAVSAHGLAVYVSRFTQNNATLSTFRIRQHHETKSSHAPELQWRLC